MDPVSLEFEDGIARVTLGRTRRRNAMDLAMWEGLRHKVEEAAKARPRALVLWGRGGHFSAGMDLKPDNPIAARAGEAVYTRDKDKAAALVRELKGYLAPLLDFPAPTIAAIEGAAIGAGFEIALHCDVRVAAETARIGLPEVRIGMIPDLGGTTLLTRLVGPGRAAMLVCGGGELTGAEAFRLGLVEEAVPEGEALAAARRLAAAIAAGGPEAVAQALGVVRRLSREAVRRGFEAEVEAGARALTSGEPVEGLTAFLERRAPRWSR